MTLGLLATAELGGAAVRGCPCDMASRMLKNLLSSSQPTQSCPLPTRGRQLPGLEHSCVVQCLLRMNEALGLISSTAINQPANQLINQYKKKKKRKGEENRFQPLKPLKIPYGNFRVFILAQSSWIPAICHLTRWSPRPEGLNPLWVCPSKIFWSAYKGKTREQPLFWLSLADA